MRNPSLGCFPKDRQSGSISFLDQAFGHRFLGFLTFLTRRRFNLNGISGAFLEVMASPSTCWSRMDNHRTSIRRHRHGDSRHHSDPERNYKVCLISDLHWLPFPPGRMRLGIESGSIFTWFAINRRCASAAAASAGAACRREKRKIAIRMSAST